MDNMMLQRQRLMQYQMQKHARTISPELQEQERLRQAQFQADYERQVQDELEAKDNYKKSFEKEVQGEFVGPRQFQPVVNGIDHTMVYNLDGSNVVVPINGLGRFSQPVADMKYPGDVSASVQKSVESVSESVLENTQKVLAGKFESYDDSISHEDDIQVAVEAESELQPVVEDNSISSDIGEPSVTESHSRRAVPNAVREMSTDFNPDFSVKRGVPNAMSSISAADTELSVGLGL